MADGVYATSALTRQLNQRHQDLTSDIILIVHPLVAEVIGDGVNNNQRKVIYGASNPPKTFYVTINGNTDGGLQIVFTLEHFKQMNLSDITTCQSNARLHGV